MVCANSRERGQDNNKRVNDCYRDNCKNSKVNYNFYHTKSFPLDAAAVSVKPSPPGAGLAQR